MKIDYNNIVEFKKRVEILYDYFEKTHQNLLNLLEDAECIDDEKFDQYHSYLKEYDALLDTIKSKFFALESENKKIESCFSQTKLLKKRRLTKLESNMKRKYEDKDDEDEFFDEEENKLLPF